MCCATSSIPPNSSRLILCRSSGGQGGQDPPPLTPPAPHGLARTIPTAILTGPLAGLRADELRRADVGDIRTSTGGGAVIHLRGKGTKDVKGLA